MCHFLPHIVFFGAIQAFFIGILGEDIGSIHTQVRNLPIVIMSKNVPAPGPGAAFYSASKAALNQLAPVAALDCVGAWIVFASTRCIPTRLSVAAREVGNCQQHNFCIKE